LHLVGRHLQDARTHERQVLSSAVKCCQVLSSVVKSLLISGQNLQSINHV